MKLIICFLFFFMIEIHDAIQNSRPSPNVIRIPLKRHRENMQNVNSHARQRIVFGGAHDKSFGEIFIGDPKQAFNVEFDTGSTHLWVYSSLYASCVESSNNVLYRKSALYNHSASTKYAQPTGVLKPLTVSYIASWIFGFWSRDMVTIGGAELQMRDFIEVTVSSQVKDANPSEHGLIGMTYDPNGGDIITEACKKIKGDLKFSFYLPRERSKSPNGTDGEVLLCGEDNSKYIAGTMKYYNEVNHLGKWHISIDRITLEADGNKISWASQAETMIDTGNLKITVPQAIYTLFYDKVKHLISGNPNWPLIDCSKIHLLPNITLTIDGTMYTMMGKDYVFERTSRECYVGVSAFKSYHWNIGTPLIRRYYTVFDIQNHRIGLAEKNE